VWASNTVTERRQNGARLAVASASVCCVWASNTVTERRQNGAGLAAASASVCCVSASDSDRAKAERCSASGARY